MPVENYKFDCGCEIPITDPAIKDIDGLPSLKIDYENIRLDCPKTWEFLGTGRTKGVFQLETNLGQAWARRILPTNINEMAALISLIRPGCLRSMIDDKSMTQHYADRKSGKEEVEYFHKALEPILKETYGIIAFQEEILEIAKQIAGFNLQEADVLRKCIAKGSLMYTKGGQCKIEKLVGKKVRILSIDQNQKLKYYDVDQIWPTGVQKVYRLQTVSYYEIELTDQHQVFTHKGWKPLCKITTKDFIAIPHRDTIEFTQIESIQYMGEKETFDFSLKDDYNGIEPCGFVNNILVHNSIGKKLPELMAKVKGGFLEGCQKKGIVTEKEAEEIFGWIEQSQKYSFNLCLSGDTTVETPRGLKRIDKLTLSDKIRTIHGYFASIKNLYYNGIQKVNIYKLESHSITCTPNHKFKTDRGIIKIKDIWKLGLNTIKVPEEQTIPFPDKIYTQDGYILEHIIDTSPSFLKRTYNLEIDSEDHLYYANGIATSNSHGVGYGLVGYWSVYAKVHFPFHFYTSWLYYAREKLEPQSEIRQLISDAKYFDISILPPSLDHIKEGDFGRFSLYKDRIRFGINDIKKIGEASSKKLLRLVNELEQTQGQIQEWNWNKLLFLLLYRLSSTTVNGLIQVGALDYLDLPRSFLLFEYNTFRKLTKREQEFISKNCLKNNLVSSLLKLINDFNVSSKRKEIILNLAKSLKNPPSSLQDTTYKISSWEEDLLGIAVTHSKLDGCNPANTDLANSTLSELPTSSLTNVFVVTEITEVNEYKIRKGSQEGLLMAFLTLEDGTGSASAIAFAESWEKNKHKLYKGNTVLISGFISRRDGDCTLIIGKEEYSVKNI